MKEEEEGKGGRGGAREGVRDWRTQEERRGGEAVRRGAGGG